MITLAMLVKDPPLDRMAMLLDYVRPVVGQVVVVVDSRTGIAAREVMETLGCELVSFDWCDDFAAARNAALPSVKGEWVLHLDPDELPSLGMMEFLRLVDDPTWRPHVEWAGSFHPDPRGYLFWTRNYFDGRQGEEWEEHWHVRLFRAGHGRWYRKVHELVELDGYPENATRETVYCPKAPRTAALIHSKAADRIADADATYARIEASA